MVLQSGLALPDFFDAPLSLALIRPAVLVGVQRQLLFPRKISQGVPHSIEFESQLVQRGELLFALPLGFFEHQFGLLHGPHDLPPDQRLQFRRLDAVRSTGGSLGASIIANPVERDAVHAPAALAAV